MLNGRKEGEVIALIPAYNEADGIAAVVTAALRYLPVFVVDDGSTDETAVRVEQAGASVSSEHVLFGVLRQVPNQGKGAALKAGFRWAVERGCDAVLTLDGDGQHDPNEIPKFLSAYRELNADLVIGQRDFSQMPPVRRLANTLGRLSFS